MTMFELVESCCGHCMEGNQCACNDNLSFDTRNMIKCCEENCKPLKRYYESNQK